MHKALICIYLIYFKYKSSYTKIQLQEKNFTKKHLSKFDDSKPNLFVVNGKEPESQCFPNQVQWLPALKRDPYPINEHLLLTYEEVRINFLPFIFFTIMNQVLILLIVRKKENIDGQVQEHYLFI